MKKVPRLELIRGSWVDCGRCCCLHWCSFHHFFDVVGVRGCGCGGLDDDDDHDDDDDDFSMVEFGSSSCSWSDDCSVPSRPFW